MLLFAAGCRTASPPPTPGQVAIANELKNVKPWESDLVKETPIIDIHTHNFNAHDLPLRNIALGRRDVYPPWTWLVSDDVAKLLAAIIVADTHPETEAERSQHLANSRHARALEVARTPEFGWPASRAFTNRAAYTATDRALWRAMTNRLAGLSGSGTNKASRLGFRERVTLRSMEASFGHKHQRSLSTDDSLLDEIGTFLGNLTSSDAELPARFEEENGPNIQFRIAHMMDTAPTYGQNDQTNGWAGLNSFTNQILCMAELQKREDAHLAYFVAYNPFRDNTEPGESLRIVQDAISNHFAYGVKLYPPAGYRPISNSIPRRPHLLFTRQPGEQWDARYKTNGVKIPDSVLDQRLLTLLCWCASNDIPVFVHSGYGEFQARSGYGPDMPNPRWWGALLTNASEAHPELKELRLCFGHSGGGDYFFDQDQYKAWGQEACDLCTQFKNVYCEVGVLDDILNTNLQATFAKNIRQLFNAPTNAARPYRLAMKMMYGSDWYMPISGDRKKFLEMYQQVFLLPDLQKYYKPFFLDNALDFLNARERIHNQQFPVDETVKAQLEKLLSKY